MKLLSELCSVPTAPFAEQRVAEYVERFVKTRRSLRLSRDRYDNLLIERRGRDPRLPRWVFTAHMDHPGFVAREMLGDGRTLDASFRGGVLAEFFAGSNVRFFLDGGREVPGVVTETTM